jgi:hypothetical protein
VAVGCNNVATSPKDLSNKGFSDKDLSNKDFGQSMAAGIEPAAMSWPKGVKGFRCTTPLSGAFCAAGGAAGMILSNPAVRSAQRDCVLACG